MPKYQTQQRKLLLSYLSDHTDQQLTAKQIALDLEKENISLSAVYRNLSDLESEGKIRRCSSAGSREVIYQFADADGCKECLHLSCKKCGTIFHMDAGDAAYLIRRVKKNEKFKIDKTDTVLYGVCEACQHHLFGRE